VKLTPVIVIDDSTMSMASAFHPNGSGEPLTVCPEWTVRNGSKVYAASDMSINGSSKFVFDGSELAKNDAGDPLKIKVATARAGTTNDFLFANGSVLKCNTICHTSTKYIDIPFVISFNSSQWYPGPGSFDFLPTNINLRVMAEGEGLILAPGNGSDYLWRLDLSGAGGLVKRGEGSLTINAANMLYTGLTKVDDGVFNLDGSSCVGKSFAGSGTIANGTLSSPTFSLDVDKESASQGTLKLAADVQLEGTVKVDLGCDASGYLGAQSNEEEFEVVSYEGDEIDLSKWRLRGSGYRGARGIFSVNDGVVSCRIAPTGAVMIVK
jgi:autotransporter-associated beta strand protein